MRTVLSHAFLLALLVWGACDPSPPVAENDAWAPIAEPALEVGTGVETFAAFSDGDTLDLVRGLQGAQHVWISLRLRGLDPRSAILDLELRRVRDEARVSQRLRVRVSLPPAEGEDYAQLAGLTLVVPAPEEALDEELTLRASVTERPESGERTVSSERRVRIAWAP